MMKKTKRVAMLFGMPRSGTTWVAKIIDSHPSVIYRHEPDSERCIAVPLLNVDSFQHGDEISRFYQDLEFIRTGKTCGKQPFFSKAYFNSLTAYLFKTSIYAAKLFGRLGIKSPIIEVIAETAQPLTLLWKSIESVGRVGAIMATDPDSKMVFLVRHPCGQIASVLSGENKNEFSSDVSSADDYGVYEQLLTTDFAKSQHLDMEVLKSLTTVQRLAWRWLIYNEVALTELQAYKDRTLIVFYDELCAEPIELSKNIFEFLDLDWCRQTQDFLDQSVSVSQASYYSVFKDPKKSSQSWKSKLPGEAVEAIKEIVMRGQYSRQFFS